MDMRKGFPSQGTLGRPSITSMGSSLPLRTIQTKSISPQLQESHSTSGLNLSPFSSRIFIQPQQIWCRSSGFPGEKAEKPPHPGPEGPKAGLSWESMIETARNPADLFLTPGLTFLFAV